MMISVVVVYEQDVGLKSSIIVDTASFNPAGVYQLPITRLRTHVHHSQSGPLKALIEELSREIRNDRSLYLTTNKSGWPPGSRHPVQKLATLSDRSLPSQQGLGYRLVLL